MVLVRNWSGNSWSWPKGKINQGESPYSCALRETLEETGYDASSLCSEDNFLVVHEDSKLTKLFVAVGNRKQYITIVLLDIDQRIILKECQTTRCLRRRRGRRYQKWSFTR